MDRVNRILSVNAGRGGYKAAREATKMIEECRDNLLSLFHAENNSDIVFTSSVTIAMNMIFQGFQFKEGDVVYLSPYEHNAVARALHLIEKEKKIIVKLLPLIPETLEIDMEKTEYLFSIDHPVMVCMTMVSNVTGYILPIEELVRLSKSYDAVTVVDAAQAAGLTPIDLCKIPIDILCFAGHKTLYGPFGVAGFALKRGVELSVSIAGGTGSDSKNLNMPDNAPARYESSSPNIIAISGLLSSLKGLNVNEHFETIKALTNYAVEKLEKLDNIRLFIQNKDKHIGIISFAIEGYESNDIGSILDDEFDIAVRTGYHCAPFIHSYLGDEEYNGTVRIGLGMFNTKEEINALYDALESL